MSNEDLPSINDIVEENNLPSYKDFIEEKELPSIEDYISESPKEETLFEETENINPVLSETAPEWSELIRLVNDLRKEIPEIPEIKYYDEELSDLSSKLTHIEEYFTQFDQKSNKIDDLDVKNEHLEVKLTEIESKIPEIPTIRYYDHDIEHINDKITQLKEDITSLPEIKHYDSDISYLIEELNKAKSRDIPDFRWIGNTFNTIDEDFTRVQGHLEVIKEKISFEVSELNETIQVKDFEQNINVKNLKDNVSEKIDQTNTRLTETKDKIYSELSKSSLKVWEYHREFKDDDRKLKKAVLSEQNKIKQKLEKEITSINEQSIKTDETLLKFFNELKEQVNLLPEVKYYDNEISTITKDVDSLKSTVRELKDIASLIKKDQNQLQENYLLNEPPSEKQKAGGQTDPLAPLDQKFATLDDLSNHYRLFINRVTTQLSTIGGGGETRLQYLDDVAGIATNINAYDGMVLQIDLSQTGEDKHKKFKFAPGGGVGAGGTWHTDSIGISTNKSVGINTSSAITGKSLYVVGDVQFTGNLNVGGTITKEDIQNLDSIGVITARSGIDVLAGGIDAVGVVTSTKVHVGVDSGFFNEDLVVNGDARVTGILTIGQGSITLDPNERKITGIDEIIIGTGTTVRLHQDTSGEIAFSDREGNQASVGIGTTVSINTTGIITASSFRGDGSQLTNIISGVGIQSGSVRVGTGFTDLKFTGVGVTIVGSGTTVTIDVPSSAITRQVETSSGVTTNFTITGGYTVGLIDVFLNGTKQVGGVDFTATNGSVVTMTPFINDGDVVEFQKIDQLRIAGITSVTNATNAFTLNSQAASYYLNYNNFSNTPTVPTNNNQLTNGAGFITTSFTNTNQLTNGAGFITATSSGTGLTGIVTSIVAGTNVTISGSTGAVTINSSGGGGSSGIEIENNGTSVGTGITAINFSTNVTVTASGGIATVTASGGGGGSSSVAIIDEVETFSTGGGSFTSGAWQDRDLNTVTSDDDDIIDLNSSTGEVTLKAAGTYKIDFRAPGFRCDNHVTRILDTSITFVRGLGSSEYSQDAGFYAQTHSMGSTIYTTTDVNQKFKLQHRCTTTQSAAYGMGNPNNVSAIGNNYYSQVIVTKLS